VTSSKGVNEPEGLGYDIAELDDVDATKEPTRHFLKGEGNNDLVEVAGRRPSNQLCVPKLRTEVGLWRESGYAGASETTKALFRWWFLEGAGPGERSFQPYFAQREAIETIVYLLEIKNGLSTKSVIEDFHEIITFGLGLEKNRTCSCKWRVAAKSSKYRIGNSVTCRRRKALCGQGSYGVWQNGNHGAVYCVVLLPQHT